MQNNQSPPNVPTAVLAIVRKILDAGGRPYLVGGATRDHFLGLASKDFDIEVFGLSLAELVFALRDFKIDAVGRAFGVLKVTSDELTVDVSLPRRESKSGSGHRGFVTYSDPLMTFAEAAARRDFTINAIGFSFLDSRWHDPYGGLQDMRDKILRHTSPAFAEDPLRVLRGCQFAARFGFKMAPDTVVLCQSLVPELSTLPRERLWEEWKKLLLRSQRPSEGLYCMVETGAIQAFPEVAAMLHVPQDPEWHPEGQDHPLGSLWVHSCMVTDAAVRVLDDDAIEDEYERLVVVLGAFCHDFGKPSTTGISNGRYRSLGHESAGAEPTRNFLNQIGAPPAVIDDVEPLVVSHLKPFHFARDNAKPGAVRRLALKVPLARLCRVARADYLGRTTPEAMACSDSRTIPETNWLMARATELAVASGAPQPMLMGRHLLLLGLPPGPKIGWLLKAAFEAQMDGAFSDEDGAVEWAKQQIANARSAPGTAE